jgi:hypothetical protein
VSIRIPRWFGVPPELIDDGVVSKMSDSDLRLCVYAYRKCDKQSSRRFRATDKEIAKTAGVSARALQDARIHLRELGVLYCSREPGGPYTYEICDLNTGRPYECDPKENPPYVKRPKLPPENGNFTTPLSPSELKHNESSPFSNIFDAADVEFDSYRTVSASPTDFNFGHNLNARSPRLHK